MHVRDIMYVDVFFSPANVYLHIVVPFLEDTGACIIIIHQNKNVINTHKTFVLAY